MAISSGDLNLAEELLNAQTNRDAEWNFLKGAICYRRGWLDEARRYYQTAVTMAPDSQIASGRWIFWRDVVRPTGDGYGGVTTGTCGSNGAVCACAAPRCLCNALGVPVCFC